MKNDFEQLQKVLAKNVRIRRKALGLSQEALALLADVDRTYVGQIERSVGNPSLKTLCKIAEQCNVEILVLLTENPESQAS